jgi:hypothetical protein
MRISLCKVLVHWSCIFNLGRKLTCRSMLGKPLLLWYRGLSHS